MPSILHWEKKFMKRRRIIFILLIVIVAIALAYFFFFKKKPGMEGDGMPPSSVKAIAAQLQPWQQKIEATGTLNADQGTLLKSEIAGRVTKIDFQSGETVKAGAPLLEINPGIARAQLDAAKAKAELSSGDYERALKLHARKFLSTEDLDTALSTKKADEAAVKQYQTTLDQYIIRAPIDGKLGLRLFNLGDYIQEGQSLVNLQSTDPLRVDFSIPENKLHAVHPGDKITIHADSFPDEQFTGSITAIDSAVDVSTRTVLVRGNISNPAGKLIPGNFVQVMLYAGKPQSLVSIPQLAITYELGNDFVYVIEKGHAVKKDIIVGDQGNGMAAITSGLKAGESIVTEGQLKLRDGAPVYVVH
jgi:membrane fusion protein (multidrug efflux system)